MSTGRMLNEHAYYFCYAAEHLISFGFGGSYLSILAITIERYLKVSLSIIYLYYTK
jgi:hypothetical protein